MKLRSPKVRSRFFLDTLYSFVIQFRASCCYIVSLCITQIGLFLILMFYCLINLNLSIQRLCLVYLKNGYLGKFNVNCPYFTLNMIRYHYFGLMGSVQQTRYSYIKIIQINCIHSKILMVKFKISENGYLGKLNVNCPHFFFKHRISIVWLT